MDSKIPLPSEVAMSEPTNPRNKQIVTKEPQPETSESLAAITATDKSFSLVSLFSPFLSEVAGKAMHL